MSTGGSSTSSSDESVSTEALLVIFTLILLSCVLATAGYFLIKALYEEVKKYDNENNVQIIVQQPPASVTDVPDPSTEKQRVVYFRSIEDGRVVITTMT